MAYILLALGVLMSLCGLVAMATGYPMIEIERGWATVITGAVLLSGGLVVVALGLVVRHLVGLRTALATVGALSSRADAPIPQPMVVPEPLMPAMPSPVSPERPSVAHQTLSATPVLAAAVPVAAIGLAEGAALRHEPHREPDAPSFEPPGLAEVHDPDPHVEPADAEPPRLPDAYVPEILLPERVQAQYEPPHHEPIHAAQLHDEPLRDGHHEAVHEEPPREETAEPPRPRSSEDLLDEAFSAFDYEMANGHAAPNGAAQATHAAPADEPAPIPSYAAAPAEAGWTDVHEPVAQHPEPSHVEPHVEPAPHAAEPEAPATAPMEPAANLSVIGRYDSEGTSYVMYSDGSIEAQSESGVYRFGSMAELKAFIEG